MGVPSQAQLARCGAEIFQMLEPEAAAASIRHRAAVAAAVVSRILQQHGPEALDAFICARRALHKGRPDDETLRQFVDVAITRRKEVSQLDAGNIEECTAFMKGCISEAQERRAQKCHSCQVPNGIVVDNNGKLDYLIKKCKGCQEAMYCSRACQTRDWTARHRDSCPRLDKA